MIGLVTIIAGYGFKIAAVPFHMWAPDVYEGEPPRSGFLATDPRRWGSWHCSRSSSCCSSWRAQTLPRACRTFAVIAAVTMTVGNLVAISQTNIKRMLAYSSIAQAGYILIALAVMSQYAMQGAMFPCSPRVHERRRLHHSGGSDNRRTGREDRGLQGPGEESAVHGVRDAAVPVLTG